MKKSMVILCAMLLVFVVVGIAAAVPYYNIVALGPGIPMALNNTGQVLIETSYKAYLWENNVTNYLGNFRPRDINESSQVVGYSDVAAGHPVTTSFLWDSANGLQNLGDLDGLPTKAYGINNSGQVVGSAGGKYGGAAFLWDNINGMQDIVGLSAAASINNYGQIAGRTGGPSDFRAMLWENGTITDLGSLPNYSPISWTTDINELGQVVGASTSNYGGGPRHAFLWDNTNGMQDLGSIHPADLVHAYAINNLNNLGQVVGSTAMNQNPYIWENGIIYSLNDLLLDANGWDLYTAFDIND